MRNKKGQALVEFIILMPIMIYVILGFIDLIIIAGNKSNLDSKMNEIVSIYKNNPDEKEIVDYLNKDLKSVEFKTAQDDKYTYLRATMDYSFVTPGLNKVFNRFEIKSERVIMNEN